TGVKLTDPIPKGTTFLAADSGGTNVGGVATWTGLTVPAGGTTTVHLGVSIAATLKNTALTNKTLKNTAKGTTVANDGVQAKSAQGPLTTGSPVTTTWVG
ncbi:MAG: hypothetical protein QOG10_4064, partial [Kribbellaceae bacterium]|nr:hypothetical protein [Kribbellaceae bacterium]